MGCRCKERQQAIASGAAAAVRGDMKAVAQSAAFVSRTLVQDARSGALRTAANTKLAQLRQTITRR